MKLQLRSRRGAASALIIMVLVLLIFFGVLALVSATADWKLATRRADWVKSYYQSDTVAVALLADLDARCQDLAGLAGSPDLDPGMLVIELQQTLAVNPAVSNFAVTATADQVSVTARISASKEASQAIDLALLVTAKAPAAGQNRITIRSWQQWQAPFDYESGPGGLWKG
jgi:hypothetical protein